MVPDFGTSGPSDMFVAETPAIPGGRHHDFRTQSFGRKPMASQASRTTYSVDMPYRLHEQADDVDDLADFMVDTDEEDDGALFSGRGRRPGGQVLGQPGDRRVVEDVPEVPETPHRAA